MMIDDLSILDLLIINERNEKIFSLIIENFWKFPLIIENSWRFPLQILSLVEFQLHILNSTSKHIQNFY